MHQLHHLQDSKKILLRQIITAGFIDRIARRVPEIDEAGNEIKNRYRYLLVMTNEFAKIHGESFLMRSSPEYIVYHQYIQSLKAKRPFLKGITAIRPTWLVELGLPLTVFSEPLASPPPSYNKDNDYIMCYARPYFGPYKWELSPCEIEYPVCPEKYRYFARFLLEGVIVPELSSFQSSLVVSPTNITNMVVTNSITNAILHPIIQKKIDTKQKLIEEWKKDPTFLLEAIGLWFEKRKHPEIKRLWPPIPKTTTPVNTTSFKNTPSSNPTSNSSINTSISTPNTSKNSTTKNSTSKNSTTKNSSPKTRHHKKTSKRK